MIEDPLHYFNGSFVDTGVSENQGVPYFGVLMIRILPFRVLYWGLLYSETLNPKPFTEPL